jgi:hypothetical protein
MMPSFSSNVIAVMQYHDNSCEKHIAFWDRRFLIEVQADANRACSTTWNCESSDRAAET